MKKQKEEQKVIKKLNSQTNKIFKILLKHFNKFNNDKAKLFVRLISSAKDELNSDISNERCFELNLLAHEYAIQILKTLKKYKGEK